MSNDKKDSLVKRDVEAERASLDKADANWLKKPGADQHQRAEEKPFDVEPFRHERSRLPFKMSDEDRHRRAKYLDAQSLSEREPMRVPELERMLYNPIRRLYISPTNNFFNSLAPKIGVERAATLRFAVPKLLMAYTTGFFLWYNLKYKRASWESTFGWTVTITEPSILPGQPVPTPKDPFKDYADGGFTKRTTHRGPKYAY